MLGAIIGDIIGSPYEYGARKTKSFPLFTYGCRPTDDSVLTVAVGCACAEANIKDEYSFKRVLREKLREIGRRYLDAGYGRMFYEWMLSDTDKPYGGLTNGSAMRVSPTAWAAGSLEEAERLAKWSAEITHDHPEGVKGAVAVASAIYLAREGKSKEEIRGYIESKYYDLSFTIEEIRPAYSHDMTCEGSVPQAIAAFLDSNGFEDAIRNAISLGGDGDTQACIAGAIAEAFYGIPEEISQRALEYIDEELLDLYFGYSDALY